MSQNTNNPSNINAIPLPPPQGSKEHQDPDGKPQSLPSKDKPGNPQGNNPAQGPQGPLVNNQGNQNQGTQAPPQGQGNQNPGTQAPPPPSSLPQS